MAFKRVEENKDGEPVSLIDIIFLLLLFFLVITGGIQGEGPKSLSDEKYPEMGGRPVTDKNKLRTLTIIIDSKRNAPEESPPDSLFILWPYRISIDIDQDNQNQNHWHAVFDSWLDYDQSLLQSRENRLYADMASESALACQMLADNINRYANYLSERGADVNEIEIWAIKSTPFAWINLIMTACSRNAIANLAFRTINIQ